MKCKGILKWSFNPATVLYLNFPLTHRYNSKEDKGLVKTKNKNTCLRNILLQLHFCLPAGTINKQYTFFFAQDVEFP